MARSTVLVANDEACYWPLWHGLVFQAQRRASREKWPPVVRGCPPRGAPPGVRGGPQFYLHELAALVLDEVACGPVFAAAPALRAIYLGIDDDACARVVEPYYRSLQAVYDRWLDVARGQIRAWTNC